MKKGGGRMRYKAYRPSGITPPGGVVLLILGGFLGPFIVQAVYVYLLAFLSNLLLRFLVVLAVVLLISYLMAKLTVFSKIRNRRVVRICAVISLILAFYASRCVYVDLVNEMWKRGVSEVMQNQPAFGQLILRWLKLFISPGAVFSSLYKILPSGVTSVNGRMISGVPLLLIWLIEVMLLVVIPAYAASYVSAYPYDEAAGLWLTKREEWPVVYVDNYREVRSQLKAKNDEPLLSAIQQLEYYQREGDESYAVLEFYRRKGYTGPYVSLTNVKAIQSGPKKLTHKNIILCRLCEIGTEEADELYRKLQKSKEEMGVSSVSVNGWLADLAFKSGRGGKRKIERKLPDPHASEEREEIEEDLQTEAYSEEVTVHVPKVTPEMEQEYLNKKNS